MIPAGSKATSMLSQARSRVSVKGGQIVLDNAARRDSDTLNDARRIVRQPVIGVAFLVLGLAFLAGVVLTSASSVGGLLTGLTISLAFALTGYFLCAYRDTFSINPSTGRWRHEKGLFPIAGKRAGTLDGMKGVEVMVATRTSYSGRVRRQYEVWAPQIVWNDPSKAPEILNALEMPCDQVDRRDAEDLCAWLQKSIDLEPSSSPSQ